MGMGDTTPVISQLKSLFELVTGDLEGAKETQEKFLDAWSNDPLKEIGDLADGIPLVGHVKGFVHLAMGDKEHFIKSEEAATRTAAVLAAGAFVAATGGAGAPILAGVAAAVAAGAAYDVATTGIESLRHSKFDPQGIVAAGDELVEDLAEGKNPRGAIFDVISVVAGDALLGAGDAIVPKGTNTVKVFRIEGRSVIKKAGEFFEETRERLIPINGKVTANTGYGPLKRLDPTIRPEAEPLLENPGEDGIPLEELPSRDNVEEVEYDPGQFDFDLDDDNFDEPRGERPNRDPRAEVIVQPAPKEPEVLFLNFGQEDRAHQFYAKRLLQHRRAVEAFKERYGTRPRPEVFTVRIKSFRVLTSELDKVRDSAIEEQGSTANSRHDGIIKVDTTQAPDQFGLWERRYTPILDNSVPRSFSSNSPWMRFFPTKYLESIERDPIPYGKVRNIIIDVRNRSVASLLTPGSQQYVQTIENAVAGNSSANDTFVPMGLFNTEGQDAIEIVDVPIVEILQSRHVKSIDTSSDDPKSVEHFEYLIDFGDGLSPRWYPEELIAEDLKDKFKRVTVAGAKDVSAVLESTADSVTVKRPDGSIDTIKPSQIFWLEEPAGTTKLYADELDSILHHAHFGEPSNVEGLGDGEGNPIQALDEERGDGYDTVNGDGAELNNNGDDDGPGDDGGLGDDDGLGDEDNDLGDGLDGADGEDLGEDDIDPEQGYDD